MPDTQNYSQKFPEIFEKQTKWIAERSNEITFVLHLGDITNNNNKEQWENASKAMNILEGKLPYAVVTGNHDIGKNGRTDVRDTDLFNQYFSYGKHSKMNGFKGAYEEGKMDNTWHEFKAGGHKWLILSLEFGPRNKVLAWASEIVKAHPKHKIIIQTHAYMYSDETRMSSERGHRWLAQSTGLAADTRSEAPNDGEQIWEKLVSLYPNVMMVVSGHVLNDGVGTLISQGKHGNTVYQMLSNYQTGVHGSENGGNGFLRILNFDIPKRTIIVKTYSPVTDTFKQETDQDFIFENVDFN
ncbi:metallophosphoesterase [Sphingobacterium chuzhouense]|uniref:Metallophosphoesterase n=1 Tax=Sphingobacterium chuzhouense TaxID=1742264 RepID=A0ABR7XQN4_9SPHI|nr:metallophosphoesterase [Sphingobacterium chuzhouense]